MQYPVYSGTTHTVLLVEDNLAHAELIKRILTHHRIALNVVHWSDGEEALAYLFPPDDAAQQPRPDLMLLDLRLPSVEGLEVLQRVKQAAALRPIPVVVLTTSSADVDIERAYTLHANSYLIKPLEFETFAQMIRAVVSYWLGWNHSPQRCSDAWPIGIEGRAEPVSGRA